MWDTWWGTLRAIVTGLRHCRYLIAWKGATVYDTTAVREGVNTRGCHPDEEGLVAGGAIIRQAGEESRVSSIVLIHKEKKEREC